MVKPASAQIHLLSCVGTRSSPNLLCHFIAHYRSLGINSFLIVLHAPFDDAGANAFRGVLKQHRIRPAFEIREYSASIKKSVFDKLVEERCDHSDWVLYADLDEFQVYDVPLPEAIRECQESGSSYVTGRMVDRFAHLGELLEITKEQPIWEQFPFGTHATSSIQGGWDKKICLARGDVAIADGGAHSVDFGGRARENYDLSHDCSQSRRSSRVAEIHHFKWDATLRRRLSDKIIGAGGDRDRIDGHGFISEYKRVKQHLDRFGRIVLSDAELISVPSSLTRGIKTH